MLSSSAGKYIANLASGSNSYTVNHGLNASVIAQVYDKSSGDVVGIDISRTDANNIVVTSVNNLVTNHVIMCTAIGAEPA